MNKLIIILTFDLISEREKHVIEDELDFDEEDDPAMYKSVKYSSSSHR